MAEFMEEKSDESNARCGGENIVNWLTAGTSEKKEQPTKKDGTDIYTDAYVCAMRLSCKTINLYNNSSCFCVRGTLHYTPNPTKPH